MKTCTKRFLEGNLEGLEYTFTTYHPFTLNGIYEDCVTGKKYQIVDVKEIA